MRDPRKESAEELRDRAVVKWIDGPEDIEEFYEWLIAKAYAASRERTPQRGDPTVGRTIDEPHRPLVCFVCGKPFGITFNFCLDHKDEYERLKRGEDREQVPQPTRRLMHCPGDSPGVTHYEDTDCAEAGCMPVGEQGREQATATPREREILQHALNWNEEYKTINHLSGDPYWVNWAKESLGMIGHYERGQASVPSPAPPEELCTDCNLPVNGPRGVDCNHPHRWKRSETFTKVNTGVPSPATTPDLLPNCCNNVSYRRFMRRSDCPAVSPAAEQMRRKLE